MKAISVQKYGGPEVLVYRDVPDPVPGPDEVVVKAEASGLNFADQYVFTGARHRDWGLPVTPGSEVIGTVAAVGSGVSGFKVGDRVGSNGEERGCFAELVIANPEALVPVPAGIDAAAACGVLMQGRTAHYLVYDAYPIKEGDVVLIHAAAGGVGSLLVQLAKNLGARVFGTVSNEDKARYVKDLGADEAFVYSHEPFADAVLRATNGIGANVIYDSVGADTFEEGLRCVATRGHLVAFGQASGKTPPIDISTDAQRARNRRSVYVSKHFAPDYCRNQAEIAGRVTPLFGMIMEGAIDVRIHKKYRLAETAQAFTDLASRGTTGKLILIP